MKVDKELLEKFVREDLAEMGLPVTEKKVQEVVDYCVRQIEEAKAIPEEVRRLFDKEMKK